jgi:protein sidekick
MYLIKMCAYNKIGFGKFNEPPLRIRTKEGIPIRAPISFQANSINSTCMGISWNEPPPQFVNGVIQGFKVVFYEDDNYELKKTQTINLASLSIQSNHQLNQYYYQMCGLKKFTKYTLSILCFTNSGDGPLTQPIQLQTLEDIPGEVNEISFINVYDKSIDIEWKPPLQPNGKILSYVIMYKTLSKVNQSEKFNKIILDSTQTNFTLRNLKSSTEYAIGIRATTRAGEGILKLTQIKSGVPPELPEPPRAIVLRTIGQTSVELEFIPGYDGKTSINKWIVEAIILNDEANHKHAENHFNTFKWYRVYEKSNAPNITKLTVENLIPFTNYSLRMFSQNVKGNLKFLGLFKNFLFKFFFDVCTRYKNHLWYLVPGTNDEKIFKKHFLYLVSK